MNLEISEKEIESIMNSVKMPEIDNINDDIELDIEKYKESLNNNNYSKIEDFKKVFENEIKSVITLKSSIINTNISKLILNTQEDQKKNIKSIEEETKAVKEEFEKIVEDTNEMNDAIGNLKSQLIGNFGGACNIISEENNDNNNEKDKNQIMTKFENEK